MLISDIMRYIRNANLDIMEEDVEIVIMDSTAGDEMEIMGHEIDESEGKLRIFTD